MTALVSILFIAMIPIDYKITNFSLHLYVYMHACVERVHNTVGLLIFEDIKFRDFKQRKKFKICQHGCGDTRIFLRLLYFKLPSVHNKRSFLQHLHDLYTVPAISDQFKLLVWTWVGMDQLIHSSPLIICCSYSGSVSNKISKSELFHHVKSFTTT